jgi:hypothetical protein
MEKPVSGTIIRTIAILSKPSQDFVNTTLQEFPKKWEKSKINGGD